MSNIEGVKILKGINFKDNRGTLKKTYINSKVFLEDEFLVNEIWFTRSKKNVVRGMHFQLGDSPSRKLVSVIQGRIKDVLIDLRKNSPTFMNIDEFTLSNDDDLTIYIPAGVAHGYIAQSNNTVVMYASDELHSSKDDIGIRWNSFNYNWEVNEVIISKRDLELKTLDEYLEENND